MPRINCDVKTCSYNQDRICCASIVNIGGKNSATTEGTCCGTFLNRLGYSNLAQYTDQRSNELDAILCRVETCVYHKDEHCTLKEIEVGCLGDAEIYTQTDCLSFERK